MPRRKLRTLMMFGIPGGQCEMLVSQISFQSSVLSYPQSSAYDAFFFLSLDILSLQIGAVPR